MANVLVIEDSLVKAASAKVMTSVPQHVVMVSFNRLVGHEKESEVSVTRILIVRATDAVVCFYVPNP